MQTTLRYVCSLKNSPIWRSNCEDDRYNPDLSTHEGWVSGLLFLSREERRGKDRERGQEEDRERGRDVEKLGSGTH